MLQQLYTVFFRRSNMRFAGYPTSATLGMPLFQKVCQLVTILTVDGHFKRMAVFLCLFGSPAF